jgi:nucleoside 2-deoxyribosyltransferase
VKAYLAGPDVFLPDAVVIGRRKREACARAGIIGRFPLDNALPKAATPAAHARAIALANEAMIRDCEIVLANLTPFRSPSADPGTAFEIGFARALGKTIHGYSAAEDLLLPRTRRSLGLGSEAMHDGAGHAIEDFGMFDNLMLDSAILDSGGQIVVRAADDLSAMAAFEALLMRISL